MNKRTLGLHGYAATDSSRSDGRPSFYCHSAIEDSTGRFVSDRRPSPEPAFVLARDWQLDDLVHFCTVSGNFSVLTVDPTFNLMRCRCNAQCISPSALGDSSIWLISCIYRSNIGPLQEDFGTYLFFASSLIGLRPEPSVCIGWCFRARISTCFAIFMLHPLSTKHKAAVERPSFSGCLN